MPATGGGLHPAAQHRPRPPLRDRPGDRIAQLMISASRPLAWSKSKSSSPVNAASAASAPAGGADPRGNESACRGGCSLTDRPNSAEVQMRVKALSPRSSPEAYTGSLLALAVCLEFSAASIGARIAVCLVDRAAVANECVGAAVRRQAGVSITVELVVVRTAIGEVVAAVGHRAPVADHEIGPRARQESVVSAEGNCSRERDDVAEQLVRAVAADQRVAPAGRGVE